MSGQVAHAIVLEDGSRPVWGQKGGASMSEPVETLEGWWVLHDFRRMDWTGWLREANASRRRLTAEFEQALIAWQQVDAERTGSFGAYRIAGHKADLLLIHLRPTLDDLIQVKARWDKTAMARFLCPTYSYVSVVELSAYLARGNPDPSTNPYLKSRLYPELPRTRYVCFYPMSKRRQGEDNWYMMDRERRAELMRGHGTVGHKYHGRVTQIISGSQGLDDWEWGVTLFADEALDFKKLVYEMRFDEASARFADFGPFYVGSRLGTEDVAGWLELDEASHL